MKKFRISAIILTFALLLSLAVEPFPVQAAKNETKCQKILSMYKKKQYTKAQNMCKKLPQKANEKCIKNMPKKMKKAYLKIATSYRDSSPGLSSHAYMWGYYLTDIDNDKKPELLIQYGSCEADVRLIIYTYKNGKTKKVKTLASAHCSYYAYPNRNGLVMAQQHMGGEYVGLLTLKKTKLKSQKIGDRMVKNVEEYITLPYSLDSHRRYDKNYRSHIDYSALK